MKDNNSKTPKLEYGSDINIEEYYINEDGVKVITKCSLNSVSIIGLIHNNHEK